MKRRFQPGLKYVFTYKKYKKFIREHGLKPTTGFKKLNGRVVGTNVSIGIIDTFLISPNWCKCIGKEDKLC